MIVTVTKYLKVRVGEPSLSAPSYQSLAPGSEVEVEEVVYQGDEFEGDNRWLKDEIDNYYWTGNTNYDNTQKQKGNISDRIEFRKYIEERYRQGALGADIDYNRVLNVANNVKASQGINSVIGILDQIISDRIPLHDLEKHTSFKPPTNHGSAMASIIAGNGRINGIAPLAKIKELPAFNEYGETSNKLIIRNINQLKGASDTNFIVNISVDFDRVALFDIIEELVSLPNVVALAAAGTDEDLAKSEIQFPADLPNVISVGSISGLSQASNIPESIHFVVPDFRYFVYHYDKEFDFAGQDSGACAVATAIAALLLSSGKVEEFSYHGVKSALEKVAIPISSLETTKYLNLINPHL